MMFDRVPNTPLNGLKLIIYINKVLSFMILTKHFSKFNWEQPWKNEDWYFILSSDITFLVSREKLFVLNITTLISVNQAIFEFTDWHELVYNYLIKRLKTEYLGCFTLQSKQFSKNQKSYLSQTCPQKLNQVKLYLNLKIISQLDY